MSVKENIEVIKEGLKTEEKFLELGIKAEKFFKKYKSKLLFGGALVLGLVGFSVINSTIEDNNILESNEVYLQLLKNTGDKNLLSELKEKNKNLYELFVVQTAIKNEDKQALSQKFDDKILRDIASYQLAILEQKPSEYTNSSYTTLQDLAVVLEAFNLIKEDKVQLAHKKLAFISLDSPLSNIVKSLLHYK